MRRTGRFLFYALAVHASSISTPRGSAARAVARIDKGRVVVGEPLPDTVVLRPVPRYTEYRYAVVNDRRVIVEPRTRRIVKIID